MAKYVDGHRAARSNPDVGNTLLSLAIVGGAGYLAWQWISGGLKGIGINPPGESPPPGSGPPNLPPTQFRLSTSYEGWILPGGEIHIVWTVDHMGPAGSYVCGWEPAQMALGCILGFHNATFQSIEAGLSVGDDANWNRYVVTGSQVFGGGVGAYDVRQYVRSLNGTVLADSWGCGTLAV
jgi:hypothetical protein